MLHELSENQVLIVFTPSTLKPERHFTFLLSLHRRSAASLQPFSHPPYHLLIPSSSVWSWPITVSSVVKGLVPAQSDGLLQPLSPQLTREQIRHKDTQTHITGKTTGQQKSETFSMGVWDMLRA